MSTRTAERRPLGALGRMGVVAALHVGLLYMIANSLGMVPAILENKTEATIIEEVRPPDEEILPPDPREFVPRTDTVVIPEQRFDLEFESPDVITGPPPEVVQRPEATGSAVPQPVIVRARPDSRYPLSQPPYPPADVRAGNTGTAEIEVYVLPNGRVGDARIVKSTGFESLDRSALDEARRKWRLAPATRDGEPFAQWHRLLVTFKLNQQR
jgi:periplasmic protein TonB